MGLCPSRIQPLRVRHTFLSVEIRPPLRNESSADLVSRQASTRHQACAGVVGEGELQGMWGHLSEAGPESDTSLVRVRCLRSWTNRCLRRTRGIRFHPCLPISKVGNPSTQTKVAGVHEMKVRIY